jgi:hypothetical protein
VVQNPPAGAPNGKIELDLFGRVSVWDDGQGGVGSLQLTGMLPLTKWIFGDDLAPEEWDFGVELRGAYGRGFATDWGAAYYNLEVGYTFFDQVTDEISIDFTTGIRPWGETLFFIQTFNDFGVGGEDDVTQMKFSASVAHPFSETTTIQLGVTQEVFGPANPRETTFKLAVWRKF